MNLYVCLLGGGMSVFLTSNITHVRSSCGCFCCNFFPIPKPKKQMANIGATPATGAAMPLYKPKKPYNKIISRFQTQQYHSNLRIHVQPHSNLRIPSHSNLRINVPSHSNLRIPYHSNYRK